MYAFNLTVEKAFDPRKHVERVLGRTGEGDVTIACWEPRQTRLSGRTKERPSNRIGKRVSRISLSSNWARAASAYGGRTVASVGFAAAIGL